MDESQDRFTYYEHRCYWSSGWWHHNWCKRPTAFRTSTSLQRLLSHIPHLALTAWDGQLSESMLSALTLPSPTAPSPFSRLRVLELELVCEASAYFERLIPRQLPSLRSST